MAYIDLAREVHEEMEKLDHGQQEWLNDFVEFFDSRAKPFYMSNAEKLAFMRHQLWSLFVSFDEKEARQIADEVLAFGRRKMFVDTCKGMPASPNRFRIGG